MGREHGGSLKLYFADVLNLLQFLCQKVVQNQAKDEMLYSQVMNIFKEIAQNEHFIPEFQNEIENLLITLVEQLN